MWDRVAWLSIVIAFVAVLLGTINKVIVKFIATQQIVSWFHVANTFILFAIFFLLYHWISTRKDK